MRKLFYAFLLPIYFLLPLTSFSQHNNFQTYSLDQGLPQATVFSIIQDNRGYLWLGTDGGGLCRFDGINFKTYRKKDGFSGQCIRSLLQDKKGRIWAGTKDEGIIIYDGLKFTSIGKKQGLAGTAILCMFEDENGTIWAGTDDGGLNKITAVKDSFNIEVIDESKGLSHNTVFDIYKDKEGRIWLATYAGVNILTFNKDAFQIDILRGGKEIPSDNITSIKEDDNGTLWFGTYEDAMFCMAPKSANENSNFKLGILSRKISYFNQQNGFNAKKIWNIFKTSKNELWFASIENGIIRGKISSPTNGSKASKYVFENYTVKDGLSNDQIYCIFEDNEKNIWIGTDGGGLCKFMGDVFSHYSEKDGLPSNIVQGIDQDSTGNLWLATLGGLTKFEINSGTPSIKNFTVNEGLSGNPLVAISAGKTKHNKNIWTAILSEGISEFDGKIFQNFGMSQGLPNNSVFSILVDRNGIVWCGTQEGIVRYDGQKFDGISMEDMKMNDKGVFTIIQDKKDNLWFGTKGGLVKYPGNKGMTTYDEVEGLTNKAVNSLVEDKDGNIWIGTSNGGLYMFDTYTQNKIKIKFITDDSLLGSNSIKSLIFQDENNLLVGTDKGFSKITFDNNGKIISVRNYDASDGFIGVECKDNAITKDKQNNIWFGTIKGLTRFNSSAENHNDNPPEIHITNLKLFFKDVDWSKRTDSISPWFNLPKSLILPYSDNHLTFEFKAISLGNSQNIKYRYMLDGTDAVWSPEMKETTVTLFGLAPGVYTFKVISTGVNGVWNIEPATFSFTISPPWYRTYLFYILCLILLVGGIYFFIKSRERALIFEKKILEDKVLERTAEIVKQNKELEKLSIVASNSENTVVICNTESELIWANNAFTNIFGYTLEEFKKERGNTIMEISSNPDVRRLLAECIEKKSGVSYESKALTKHKGERWFQTTLSPVFDESGKLKNIVFIDSDITELKTIENQLQEKNKEITDSITYAKRIQDAILPPISFMKEKFPNSFVLFKPKDIVAGDFYWMEEIGDMIFIAAADCTGHGVPGAMVSVVCSNAMNRAVKEFGLTETGKILDKVTDLVVETFEKSASDVKDGMDISILSINKITKQIQWSGANNPLWYFENKELKEITADKQPIGKSDLRKPFTTHIIECKPETSFYLFTDGFADQFGGPKGKKFKYKQFQETLSALLDTDPENQQKSLDIAFENWKGNLEQVDDVCIIGIRIY